MCYGGCKSGKESLSLRKVNLKPADFQRVFFLHHPEVDASCTAICPLCLFHDINDRQRESANAVDTTAEYNCHPPRLKNSTTEFSEVAFCRQRHQRRVAGPLCPANRWLCP